MECVESAAEVVFISCKGLLESAQTVYAIERWNEREIVSRPAPARCGDRVLVLDLGQRRATTRIAAPEDDARCKAQAARTLELVTGFKVRADALEKARSF